MTNTARRHLLTYFLIGLVLTIALAGVNYVAFAGLRVPFVPYALAEILRDATPGPLKTMSIEVLAFAAKSLLVIVSVGLFVLIGGGLAVLHGAILSKWPIPKLIGGALLGVLFFIVSLPIELARDWVPSDYVFGPLGLLGLYVLWGIALDQTARGALARPDMPATLDSPVMTRRDFLIQTAVGGVFVGVLSGLIGRFTEAGLFNLRGLSFPAVVTPDPDGFLPALGTWPEITSNDAFYKVDIGVGGAPKLDGATWKLKIGGLVDKPVSYGLDDLTKGYTPVSFPGTLMCISNPVGGDLTGTAVWEGIRLADVLKAAGVKAGAKQVVFHCSDSYSESLPIDIALDPNTFLVYRMNGVPLPNEHGYPMRVYLPTHYGMKNPKWITSIEVIDTTYKGYWVQQGWSSEARIKPTTILTTNGDYAYMRPGSKVAEIGGIANGGGRGVASVEIRVGDKGNWQPARLRRAIGPFAWVLWRAEFPAEANKRYKVSVRMVDGDGKPQIETEAPPHPDGANGLHSKEIATVQLEPTATPPPPPPNPPNAPAPRP